MINKIVNQLRENQVYGNVRSILKLYHRPSSGISIEDKLEKPSKHHYIEFNKNGYRTKKIIFGYNNVTFSKINYFYDKDVFKKVRVSKNPEEVYSVINTYEYRYNKNQNKMVFKLYFNDEYLNDQLLIKYIYKYTKDGNLQNVYYFDDCEILQNTDAYSYNQNKNIVKISSFDKNEKRRSFKLKDYDNHKSHEVYYDKSGNIVSKDIRSFDCLGNQIMHKSLKYPSLKCDLLKVCEYNIDNKNNWINQFIYKVENNKKTLHHIFERKIKYY